MNQSAKKPMPLTKTDLALAAAQMKLLVKLAQHNPAGLQEELDRMFPGSKRDTPAPAEPTPETE